MGDAVGDSVARGGGEQGAEEGIGARVGEPRRFRIGDEDDAVRRGARRGKTGVDAGDARVLERRRFSFGDGDEARAMMPSGREQLTRIMRLIVPAGQKRPSSSR